MRAMNYTKGKWKVESFDRDELGAWRLRADGQSIMRLSGFQTPTENKANAQLIASAPDLYEALKAIIDAENEEFESLGYGRGQDARKALAKAEEK